MSKTISILLSLFLLFILAACGGGVETAAPPQATAVESAAASPTVEEAAPEVVQEATATDEPEPTAEPEPTTESEPAEDPITAAGDGWGESGVTAQSACDHPYFPLRTGATWTMAGDGGEAITWEVVSVEGDMQSATAAMEMSSGELVFNYTWDCSQSGGLVSFGFGNQGLAALGPEVNIEISEGSGVFLPAAQELVPGYSWDTSYRSVYSLTQVDGDLEMEINGEMATMQTSIVLSEEALTFGEEMVPGLLIQQDSQVDMIMNILDESVESSISSGGEIELGRGVGMLRQRSFTDFGDFEVETTEVYVP